MACNSGNASRLFIVVLCLVVAGTACRKSSPDDHLRRASAYSEESKFQEAIIELRAALQIDPRRGDVRLKLGDAYARTNDGNGALREYTRAADLLPKSADAQIKAGSYLLLAGAYEDAKTRADRALEIEPKNTAAQILRGNALAGLKDFDLSLIHIS